MALEREEIGACPLVYIRISALCGTIRPLRGIHIAIFLYILCALISPCKTFLTYTDSPIT